MITEASENFNKPDNALTIGTAQTGQAWVNEWGICGIGSNEGKPVSSGGGFPPFYPCASVTTTKSDGILTLDLTALPGMAGCLWRWSAGLNGFFLSRDLNDTSIYKAVNGLGTTLFNLNVPGPNPTGQVEVDMSGNNMSVYFEGSLLYSFSDAFNATAVRHGVLFGSSASNPRVDNFLFQVAEPAPDINHQGRALLLGLG